MSMQTKCITCPEFKRLCVGSLAVIVEWRIDVGLVSVERLLGSDPDQPGEWESCERIPEPKETSTHGLVAGETPAVHP